MHSDKPAAATSTAPDHFRLTVEHSVNVIELSLPLSLDSSEFDKLNQSLGNLFSSQPGAHWVLDLSALSYMGSSSLGLMVNLRQRVKSNGGRLVLCGMSHRLLEIFRTCCLEKLFDIAKTRQDAIKRA